MWLYENQYMPATGGKAYMLIADDIQDLAINDEYRLDRPSLFLKMPCISDMYKPKYYSFTTCIILITS